MDLCASPQTTTGQKRQRKQQTTMITTTNTKMKTVMITTNIITQVKYISLDVKRWQLVARTPVYLHSNHCHRHHQYHHIIVIISKKNRPNVIISTNEDTHHYIPQMITTCPPWIQHFLEWDIQIWADFWLGGFSNAQYLLLPPPLQIRNWDLGKKQHLGNNYTYMHQLMGCIGLCAYIRRIGPYNVQTRATRASFSCCLYVWIHSYRIELIMYSSDFC